MNHRADLNLDLSGTECPWTVVKIGRAIGDLDSGAVLELTSDRRGLVDDVRAWCEATGVELLEASAQGRVRIRLRKP
jgi:TusA-related sulfurtransferase